MDHSVRNAVQGTRVHPILALVTCAVLAWSPSATAQQTPIVDFFAGQGCAIGPTTRALALAEGFEPGEIDALVKIVRADPNSLKLGEWFVLSGTTCTIRPPEVKSELALDDPEIVSRITAIDAYPDDTGCYFHADDLYEELLVTRGWLPDKANTEYLRFLAENLVSGALAFYGDDPLSTPVGLQLTGGDCADVPAMGEIIRSHKSLIAHFDQLIRLDMKNAVCGKDDVPSWRALQLYSDVQAGHTSNAWTTAQMRFILMGAGWIEGITFENRGTPRPPLCVFE